MKNLNQVIPEDHKTKFHQFMDNYAQEVHASAYKAYRELGRCVMLCKLHFVDDTFCIKKVVLSEQKVRDFCYELLSDQKIQITPDFLVHMLALVQTIQTYNPEKNCVFLWTFPDGEDVFFEWGYD